MKQRLREVVIWGYTDTLMEPEISTKMLQKLTEKLRVKFPATSHGYSMVKIAHLDDAFLEVF